MATAQPPPSTHHSLAFRVMRLCRPSLQAEDAVLRLDPLDLVAPEDLFDDPSVPSSLLALGNLTTAADFSYRHRFQLRSPLDAMALPGLLMLPQSFGAIYLGEKFCSYISINNSSNSEARDVVIKAEIQTERQRLLLLDTSKSPVESIRSGGRYDFIVEHDVKELGPHTLVCSALYNDGDSERKYLPQFFKFQVANPLSVRTKVRAVKAKYLHRCIGRIEHQLLQLQLSGTQNTCTVVLGELNISFCSYNYQDKTYLEACIENHTKSNLYMDQVDFEPAPHWNSTALGVDDHPSESKSITREIFKMPGLIRAGGGIRNYLYQLIPTSHENVQLKVEGSNVLGKLQITWRSNLGEPGRLQTQNILGSPITKKEVEVQVLEVPSAIIMERPFLMQLKLKNHIDRKMGPFEVYVAQDDASEERAIMINGLQKLVIPHLEAFGFAELQLNIIATKPGIQKIAGITVSHIREGRVYDTLPDVEIFVNSTVLFRLHIVQFGDLLPSDSQMENFGVHEISLSSLRTHDC